MKVIVLAAGYATRLYPLTLTQPKSLLPIAGKPMLERLIEALAPIGGLERVYVVTNTRFAPQFEHWAATYRTTQAGPDFTLVNDGSTDESNKLGAIGDLHLVLTRERVEDDLIVVAADNLFSESLEGFGRFCRAKGAPVVGLYDVGRLEETRKYNAVALAADGRITHFEEKPSQPLSSLIAIALYFYPRAVLPWIHRYVAEGNHPDQPGRLIQWLYPRLPVYTWAVPGLWFDIGSRETLEEAHRAFARRF